jgi:hypothetical protein
MQDQLELLGMRDNAAPVQSREDDPRLTLILESDPLTIRFIVAMGPYWKGIIWALAIGGAVISRSVQ